MDMQLCMWAEITSSPLPSRHTSAPPSSPFLSIQVISLGHYSKLLTLHTIGSTGGEHRFITWVVHKTFHRASLACLQICLSLLTRSVPFCRRRGSTMSQLEPVAPSWTSDPLMITFLQTHRFHFRRTIVSSTSARQFASTPSRFVSSPYCANIRAR